MSEGQRRDIGGNSRAKNTGENRNMKRTDKSPASQRGSISKKKAPDKRKVHSSVRKTASTRQRAATQKRNKEIIRKNQFIGVDDSYLKKKPDRAYNDGYDAFSSEFKASKSRRRPVSPKKRKLRKALYLSLFIIFVASLGVVLSLTVFFDTESITVSYVDGGQAKYADEDIIKASQLKLHENMFLSEKSSAAEKILLKFPYIETAKINIKLPDTLDIKIKQALPEYCFQNEKEFMVIGTNGKIVEKVKKLKYDIPVLKGINLSGESVGDIVSFDSNSEKNILESIIKYAQNNSLLSISEIDMTSLSDLSLRYEDRINILLGTNDDLDYKLKTANAIINEKLDKSERGTLDVSACNEGSRQSSFLPENMENEPDISNIPTDDTESDNQTDTDNESTDTEEIYDDDGSGY